MIIISISIIIITSSNDEDCVQQLGDRLRRGLEKCQETMCTEESGSWTYLGPAQPDTSRDLPAEVLAGFCGLRYASPAISSLARCCRRHWQPKTPTAISNQHLLQQALFTKQLTTSHTCLGPFECASPGQKLLLPSILDAGLLLYARSQLGRIKERQLEGRFLKGQESNGCLWRR